MVGLYIYTERELELEVMLINYNLPYQGLRQTQGFGIDYIYG